MAPIEIESTFHTINCNDGNSHEGDSHSSIPLCKKHSRQLLEEDPSHQHHVDGHSHQHQDHGHPHQHHDHGNSHQHHDHGHSHSHGCFGSIKPCLSQKNTFIVNIVMTFVIFVMELVIGNIFGSISLVSDSFHMLSDVISMVIGLYALIKASADRTIDNKKNMLYSYGFERYQIFGSVINGLFLLAFSFNIIVESVLRIYQPEAIKNPMLILITGIVGFCANLISLLFFHAHIHNHSHGEPHRHTKGEQICEEYKPSEGITNLDESAPLPTETDKILTTIEGVRSELNEEHLTLNIEFPKKKKPLSSNYLNMFGVYLHILADLMGSILVIVVAALALTVKDIRVQYADPTLSMVLAGLMIYGGFNQLHHSVPTLLQKVPNWMNLKQIKNDLLKKFPQVLNVHELHVWQLASSIFVGSVHVKVPSDIDIKTLLTNIHKFFHNYEIYSITIQPELVEISSSQEEIIKDDDSIDEYCNFSHNELDVIKNTCCPHNHRGNS